MALATQQTDLPAMPERTPAEKACWELIQLHAEAGELKHDIQEKEKEAMTLMKAEDRTSIVIKDGEIKLVVEITESAEKVKVRRA